MLADLLILDRNVWRPPPDLKVSEWANQHRRLSPEDSAEPGDFDMDRTPFMREILDTVIDERVQQTWLKKGAQIAYTTNLCNILGYFIHQQPAPIMMLMPTLALANMLSKDRLSTMIRDSPVLAGLIDESTRISGNTLLYKKFPGGHITLAGANSPASLQSRPIRGVLFDEVDQYKAGVGDQGDPILLLEERTATFWNRFFFAGGTPTTRKASRVNKGWESGDKRFYHVPCPSCGELIRLIFEPEEKGRRQLCVDEDSKYFGQYLCQACDEYIPGEHQIEMLSDESMGGSAKWIPTKEFEGIASFHISKLYSPWVTWEEFAIKHSQTKDDPEQWKTFVNLSLGECTEDAAERIDPESLLVHRQKNYGPNSLPDEVRVITAGGDTQDDRIELEVVGWGAGEESWSIDYRTFWGNTAELQVWRDLDEYLANTEFQRIDGRILRVRAMLQDSGGHRRDQVYAFCRGKARRKVYPCKGASAYGKPVLAGMTRQKKQHVRLVNIGTDTAKELIFGRLELGGDGPGRCHFPLSYDEKYFQGLTSEEKKDEYRQGSHIGVWMPRKDQFGSEIPNEPLDCRVYALAALRILPINLSAFRRQETAETPRKPEETEEKGAQPAEKPREKPVFRRNPRASRRKSWMNR